MQQLDIIAKKSNLPQVLAFVDGQLENHNCPAKLITQIDLAVEEVFTNISSYAYDPDVGIASVQVDITDEPISVKISFIDSGCNIGFTALYANPSMSYDDFINTIKTEIANSSGDDLQ